MNNISWIRRGLISLALTACLTVNAVAASYGVGRVNASALHLRAEPSTTSDSLGVAYSGASVEVLEDASDGWYKVSFNGAVGYMSAEYLLVTVQDGEAAIEDEQGDDLGNGKVTVAAGPLNIRTAPSLDASKVGSVPKDTVVALEGYEDGWYLVTYRGITGYISEDYITRTTEKVTVASTGSTIGENVVAKAKNYLGCPYVYGASGPRAFDCSGFTSFIYGLFGYTLPHSASSQLNSSGVSVSQSDLQPGDLVFFRDYSCAKSASHTGIYIGGGQFIHASSSRSGGVKISALSESWYAKRYVGAKRIL